MSARELARRIGMRYSTLGRRLTGEIDFTVGELASIASLLDVPVSSLLGENVPVTAGSGPTHPTPTHPPSPSVPGPGRAA